MNNTLKTEQQIKDDLETSFLPLQQSLSQDGATRGPLWFAYHHLILFSHWGERLPVADEDFKMRLGISDPGRYTWFTHMTNAYSEIKKISTEFDKNVYNKIVKLTNNLRQFAMDAKSKDGTFKTIIDLVNEGLFPDALELIEGKQNDAKSNAAQAVEVNTALNNFSSTLNIAEEHVEDVQNEVDKDEQTSQATIDKYQAGADVEGSIKNFEKLRDEYKAEYDHDVVVAWTTLTYYWVPFIGLIAAGVVAGIYGSQASAALNKLNAAINRINTEHEDLERNLKIRGTQKLALNGLGQAKKHCIDAITEIEVVQSAWQRINGDLEGVAKNLKDMTVITDEDKRMKSKALVIHFATIAAEKWTELFPMIDELSNAVIGTNNFETMDPGEMADKIEKEIAQQNKATL